MRVLYASHTSVISGAERTLLDLLRALPAEIEPVVACPPGELHAALGELGVPCRRMVGTRGSLRIHPVHSSRALAETAWSAAQLRAAAASCRADLIHANSIRASLIASAARPLMGPRVISHLHDVLPPGRVGSVIARTLAVTSSVVLANSRYTAADFEVKAAGRGCLRVVDNPVDLARFDPTRLEPADARTRLDLPAREPLIGIIAQITPWKGQSDAIRTLAIARKQHPELKLVIAGAAKFVDAGTRYDNHAYARSLPALARELGVQDAVIFTGEIDDVPALIAALDLVLVPSWEEPFGRVVIEAMAMRTLVIATNVGGPADIISDGIDGVLLPPRRPDLWGNQVTQLLRQRGQMAAMGDAACLAATNRYDLPSFTRLIRNSYDLASSQLRYPSRTL